MTAARAWTLTAVLTLSGAPAALAQDQPEASAPQSTDPSAELEAIVRDLGSPNLQVRIDATGRLLSGRSITLRRMEDRLRAGGLTPEQHERLLSAAFRRFCSEPRAGMGIGWDQMGTGRGVVLNRVIPEFPAAQLLRIGDHIVAAGGESIDSSDQIRGADTLRAVIISHDPGDDLPVTIVRSGETLNLTVRLAEFSKVSPNQAEPDESVKLMAWELRRRGHAPAASSGPKPIPSGLSNTAWEQGYTEDSEPGRPRALDGDASRTYLVAGGESRGATPPITAQTGLRPLNARIVPMDLRPLQGPQPPGNAAQVQLQQLLLLAETRRDSAVQRIQLLTRRLSNPAIPESVKQTTRAQIKTLTLEVQNRELEIQQLKRQVRP